MERSLTLQERGNGRILVLETIILALLLLSVFLMPPFSVGAAYPSLYLSDVLLPFMGLSVLYHYRLSFFRNSYVVLLLLFAAYILITMAVNHRLGEARDYFEILKVIKLLVAVLFIAAIPGKESMMKLLRVIFVLLLVFNFFQYTGFLNFNNIIEPYYSTEIQLSAFGRNSLGEPDTRRLLGTMGNPNINSLLFLFFTVLFMPGKASGKYDRGLYYVSILCCFFCQSRTGFLALIVILVASFFLFRYTRRMLLEHLVVLPVLYILFMLCDGLFLNFNLGGMYIGSLMSDEITNNSFQKRLKVWKELWQMIKQKPVFGHAPYKEYFYTHNLYAENEYILMTWRYGFIGLIIYKLSLIVPAWLAFKNRTSINAKRLILYTIVLLITALTNNPISDPNILIMFAVMIGMFFSDMLNSHDEKAAAHGH